MELCNAGTWFLHLQIPGGSATATPIRGANTHQQQLRPPNGRNVYRDPSRRHHSPRRQSSQVSRTLSVEQRRRSGWVCDWLFARDFACQREDAVSLNSCVHSLSDFLSQECFPRSTLQTNRWMATREFNNSLMRSEMTSPFIAWTGCFKLSYIAFYIKKTVVIANSEVFLTLSLEQKIHFSFFIYFFVMITYMFPLQFFTALKYDLCDIIIIVVCFPELQLLL